MMRKQKYRTLFPVWAEDRGLSFFLGFLVLIAVFVPMVRLSRSGRIGLDMNFAFMLFSGAIATIRHRMFLYRIVAVTFLEFTADLIVEFNPSLGHWGCRTLAGHGRSAYRTTLSLDPDRNLSRNVVIRRGLVQGLEAQRNFSPIATAVI